MAKDAETVRRSYEALNHGDLDAAMEALDPEAEWHESEALPGTGVYRGRGAIRAFLLEFLSSWESFQQEVEETREAGGRVCALIHLSATGRGSHAGVDARYAHLWRMRDGSGVRVDAFYDCDEALDALEADRDDPAASDA